METPSHSSSASPGRDPHHTLVRDTLRRLAGERAGVDGQACDVLYVMVDTVRLLRLRLVGRLAEYGLTEAKFHALLFLRRLAPQTTTAAELAYHAGISRSAMTETIDQLEAAQWVERSRSREDRRTVRIGLRPEGRRVIDLAARKLIEETDRLAEGVSCADLRAALRVCEQVGVRLSNQTAAASDEV
jgi:DNA-binding MarR family transcriptional regulator